MLTTRTAWFPLRSNIAYFETTGPSLDLESRVKQMAMLCDELYFEPGLVDVTVSDAGAHEFRFPPSQLDEDDIRQPGSTANNHTRPPEPNGVRQYIRSGKREEHHEEEDH